MLTDFLDRIAVDWHVTLAQVVERAGSLGPGGVVVFDLDSTVFDNRPRQARIVREYGEAHGEARLARCQSFHFTSGWDLKAAALSCGMSLAEYEPHARPLKQFWGARFFTSDYCALDVEIVGAPRYLHRLVRTGVRLMYLTGRHEPMREGTVRAMEKTGMPTPTADGRVSLAMKPTLKESDDDYKRDSHHALAAMGTVVAAFDNEPTHINDYAVKFPSALAVHLATDHSGRPVPLHQQVISIPHFAD